MLTKEELLQKGISEEVADEIIASSEVDESDNSLQALQKAIGDKEPGESTEEDLSKAKKGGDDEDESGDDEDTDYKPEYMKKYMKRYMKENKKACGKMAKEVGLYEEKMAKAVEDLDLDAEGAVVEMTDLSPYLEAQTEFNSALAKAVEEISEQISFITDQSDKSFDLMQKAARVQIEQAEGFEKFLAQPQGRKGVTASVDMQKAQEGISVEGNKEIYKVLMKAVKEKDAKAGQVISAFESAGQNANKLNPAQKSYIKELLDKEAK